MDFGASDGPMTDEQTWFVTKRTEKHMKKIAGVSLPILATIVMVTLLASCSRSKSGAEELPAGSVSLVGAGSSFDAILFKR